MAKDDIPERRGPIEKTQKGWPINPLGVIALIIFGLIILFLIARPLISQKAPISLEEQSVSVGGRIIKPAAGDIVRSNLMTIELSVDEPQKAQKVQFWAKIYADGKWQMIGEITSAPFKLNWQITDTYQNKAIALTSHIYQKDGNIIKDPGGWREGIIILSQ